MTVRMGSVRRIGNIFEDTWDAVTSPIADGFDFVRHLPGFEEAGDALTDFANTTVGKVVLRTIATAMTGPLQAVLGPQLGTIAWAIPGVIRGEKFDEAWLAEFKNKCEQLAELYGGEFLQQYMDQFHVAMQELADNWDIDQLTDWSFKMLSSRVRVREDVSAYAISLWNRIELPNPAAFDPSTGNAWATTTSGGAHVDAGTFWASTSVAASGRLIDVIHGQQIAKRGDDVRSVKAPSLAASVRSKFAPSAAPTQAVKGVAPTKKPFPTALVVGGAAVGGAALWFLFLRK